MQLKIWILVLCIIASPLLLAQVSQPAEETNTSSPDSVEVLPVPFGGMMAIGSKIVYPDAAKKEGLEGKVLVSFVVNKDGSVTTAKVLKSDNAIFNDAAMNAVKSTTFKPGTTKGKAVDCQLVIPIVFKLDPNDKAHADSLHPSPVGGMEAFLKNIVYPEDAKKANIEGKVILKATIDEQGNIASYAIIKSVSQSCDEAAINALKATKFIAAKKDGKPVKMDIVIPVMFKLQ